MSNIERRIKKIEDKVGLNQEQIIVYIIDDFDDEPSSAKPAQVEPDRYYGNYCIRTVSYSEYLKIEEQLKNDFKELQCKRKTSTTD